MKDRDFRLGLDPEELKPFETYWFFTEFMEYEESYTDVFKGIAIPLAEVEWTDVKFAIINLSEPSLPMMQWKLRERHGAIPPMMFEQTDEISLWPHLAGRDARVFPDREQALRGLLWSRKENAARAQACCDILQKKIDECGE